MVMLLVVSKQRYISNSYWPGRKTTKHVLKSYEDGVAFRSGLATKLLRMRSKATKDDFASRIGSAAKLLRKCSKYLHRRKEIVSSAFLAF